MLALERRLDVKMPSKDFDGLRDPWSDPHEEPTKRTVVSVLQPSDSSALDLGPSKHNSLLASMLEVSNNLGLNSPRAISNTPPQTPHALENANSDTQRDTRWLTMHTSHTISTDSTPTTKATPLASFDPKVWGEILRDIQSRLGLEIDGRGCGPA